MIETLAEVRIFSSFPCIALVCIIFLLCIVSRFLDHISIILKLFVLIIFAFQVVWQIIDGATFQEMVIIWCIEMLMYQITTKGPNKEIPQKYKLKEENLEGGPQEASIQDTKEDNQ